MVFSSFGPDSQGSARPLSPGLSVKDLKVNENSQGLDLRCGEQLS